MNQQIPSYFQSLLACKCPRCRKGNIFKHSATNLNHFADIHENCSHCGVKYEIEPGFFWGAMYITYALVTAVFFFFLILFFTLKIKWQIIAIIYVFTIVVLIPLLVRYSRVILLYVFSPIHFDKTYFEKTER